MRRRVEIKITCLVTDNAANMMKIRKIVSENTERPLHTFACQPHAMNLLVKDVLNQADVKNTTSKVIGIAKFLRNNHAAHAELGKLGLSKPPMPSETRWCSMNGLVKYYEKNYTSIAVCIQKVSRTFDKVYRFSEEIQLRRECKSLLEFLGPVMKALNTLQGDYIF